MDGWIDRSIDRSIFLLILSERGKEKKSFVFALFLLSIWHMVTKCMEFIFIARNSNKSC